MILLAILAACSGKDATSDDTGALDAVDARVDFPDPPVDGQQFITPEWTIEPHTEVQYCYVTTWRGGDTAINFQGTYQSHFGHHIIFLATKASEADLPDDTQFDCTLVEALPMEDLEPLVVAPVVGSGDPPSNEYTMPDGMGVRLKDGTRLVMQSHYVNTSADRLLVQDAINLGLVDQDQVETWMAPFAHTDVDLVLPPNQETTLEVSCTWEEDVNVLFLTGHMHEWGTRYAIDWTHGDTTERIYEIETWDPAYRDVPPVNDYEGTPLTLSAGDTFTTTCTWWNDQDTALTFPHEMCATSGMVYPQKVPLICEPGD